MNIQELMTKPAVTCRHSDSLNTAAQLMWEHDCGALPIVDDGGSLVGMITDRDICMAAYTQGSPLDRIPVWNSMAKEVFSCHEHEPLEVAERLMGEKQVRRVPVVDAQNRPLGMLSLNDVARHAAAERKNNGLDREVTQTLAAIGKPRQSMPASRSRSAERPSAQPRAAAV
jgi:CBS domain-containing protein